MQQTFNPDHAVKPDDWKKPLCKNCEHLQNDGSFFCKNQENEFENDPEYRYMELDPEHMSCNSFKNRYR